MDTWTSVFAVVSAVYNMLLWIAGYLKVQAMSGDKRPLETIKASLIQLNAMCIDTEKKGDHKKPAAMARFISDAAHMAKLIEHQVDSLLGTLTVVPKKPVGFGGKLLGWIFPTTKIRR